MLIIKLMFCGLDAVLVVKRENINSKSNSIDNSNNIWKKVIRRGSIKLITIDWYIDINFKNIL